MAKSVVLITLLTTTFVLLVFLSQKIKSNHNNHHALRVLGRRVGFKNPPQIFDPLVVKMERMAAEKGVNLTTPHDSDHTMLKNTDLSYELVDENEYFNDDGSLNVTLRLMYLFPALDKAPKDGMIDYKELEAWTVQQAIDRLHYRTNKEFQAHDKDGDGLISFSEYLPHFSKEDIERNEKGHGDAGWWKEQFRNADADSDGKLNFDEFQDLLHPEDSNNEHIHNWLLREKIRQMDRDHDQKLNLMEFRNGAYETYKTYIEFEKGGRNILTCEQLFNELDFNQDWLLRVEELTPILQYLNPGELSYAKYYTRYLMNEADDNKDGKLTLDEMIKHELVFYNTVYPQDKDDDEVDDDYDDDFHDEF